MPFDNITSRSDVSALIPEDIVNEMLTGVANQSLALNLFRRLPMSTSQSRMPVLSALPVAYFVNGDTGLKQTSEQAWANKYLNAEEIAVIIPIPQAVVDDLRDGAGFDFWAGVQPNVEEAIARVFDAAVVFGTNKPASWPDAIATAAIAAGNTVTRVTPPVAATGGVPAQISDLFATIEADGYDVNGMAANRTYRGMLRNARGSDGNPLMEVSPSSAYGVNIVYPMRGLWPTGALAVEMIAGDFTQGVIAIRQDFQWKLLTEAVITDGAGAIVYNLAQQDMVAMRVTFRAAFQVANPINYDQAVEANRYPFGVMRAP